MKIEALKLGNETYIPNHSIVVLYSLLHFQQSLNKNVASINTASKSSTYIHAPTVCQTRESNVHSAPRYSLELQSPIAFKDPACNAISTLTILSKVCHSSRYTWQPTLPSNGRFCGVAFGQQEGKSVYWDQFPNSSLT